MGYYGDQTKKELEKPPKEIAVVDPAFVFKAPIMLYMEHHGITTPKYIFKGIDGKTYFTGKDSLTKCILYDSTDAPLVNIRTSLSGNYKVYLKDKKETLLIETTSKFSWVANKLIVKYHNIATESEETLDLNMESYYRSAGLFAGKEKENAPMICKIMRMKGTSSHSEYSIEMAAGVDNVFLLAIGIIFMSSYEAFKQHKKRQHKRIVYN